MNTDNIVTMILTLALVAFATESLAKDKLRDWFNSVSVCSQILFATSAFSFLILIALRFIGLLTV